MKLVQTTLIAGLTFFLSTGISFAADMGDLELKMKAIADFDETIALDEVEIFDWKRMYQKYE